MTLSDYDTSVEKIAALKAAQLDPSITTYLTTADAVNLTETIYILTNQYKLNGVSLFLTHDESYAIPSALYPGDTIQINGGGVMYVKDSDITYSEPITTYQNRITSIMTAQLVVSTGWTVGANGAIIKSMRKGGSLEIDGTWFSIEDNDGTSPHMIPLKSGDVISGSNPVTYIDLPADW